MKSISVWVFLLVGCSTKGPIPKQLGLTGDATLKYASCSTAYTVTATDSSGSQVLLASNIVITLGVQNKGGPLGAEFFTDATCARQVATVSIEKGLSSATFYMKGFARSDLELLVDDGPGAMKEAALEIQITNSPL